MAKTKSKAKKILSIVLNVIIYVFFAICLFSLILSVTAKKDADGAVSLFGKQWRIIVSDSMAKCEQTDVSEYKIKSIPVKSMVFIDLVPKDEQERQDWYAELKVGDVLTFKYVYVAKQNVITHRITSITAKANGGYVIELKGDNKLTENVDTLEQIIDTSDVNSPNYVIGKVTGQSYVLGVLLTAVKSPVGIVCIVIVPCLIISVFEIVKLVGYINERKRKNSEKNKEQKDAEIEELKRQIAELQKSQIEEQNKSSE